MRIPRAILPLAALALAFAPGCIVDDTGGGGGGGRGQPNVPAASLPDAGSPIRRESAAKTLNDADPEPPRRAGDGETLEVEPAPGRVPPPPVQ